MSTTSWVPGQVYFRAVNNAGIYDAPSTANVTYGWNCPTFGYPITYTWSFGDGEGTTGIHVSHSYATSGTYLITLSAHSFLPYTSTDSIIIKVDTVPPTNPYPLFSDHSTFDISSINRIWFYWTPSTDEGGSGLKGYYYSMTQNYNDVVTTTDLYTSSTIIVTDALADSYNWYFHIAAVDNMGNMSQSSYKGPYSIVTTHHPAIDTSIPYCQLEIDNPYNVVAQGGNNWILMMQTINCDSVPSGWLIDNIHWKTFGIDTYMPGLHNITELGVPSMLSIEIPDTTTFQVIPIEAGVHLVAYDYYGNVIEEGWHNDFISYRSLNVLSNDVTNNSWSAFPKNFAKETLKCKSTEMSDNDDDLLPKNTVLGPLDNPPFEPQNTFLNRCEITGNLVPDIPQNTALTFKQKKQTCDYFFNQHNITNPHGFQDWIDDNGMGFQLTPINNKIFLLDEPGTKINPPEGQIDNALPLPTYEIKYNLNTYVYSGNNIVSTALLWHVDMHFTWHPSTQKWKRDWSDVGIGNIIITP